MANVVMRLTWRWWVVPVGIAICFLPARWHDALFRLLLRGARLNGNRLPDGCVPADGATWQRKAGG